jgi:hypothetical protein
MIRIRLGTLPGDTRVPQVQFAALSHFEERYEDFQADAVHLRRRFSPDSEQPSAGRVGTDAPIDGPPGNGG